MKKKSQHGGKRKGAGRKPGTAKPTQCPMCAILLAQLEDGRKREERQAKQITQLLGQTEQVIFSKFETVHHAGPKPQSDIGNAIPPSALVDVDIHDDDAFIAKAESLMPQ